MVQYDDEEEKQAIQRCCRCCPVQANSSSLQPVISPLCGARHQQAGKGEGRVPGTEQLVQCSELPLEYRQDAVIQMVMGLIAVLHHYRLPFFIF